MRKLFFFFNCLFFLASCSTSNQKKYKKYQGYWQVSPITIDGKKDDWSADYKDYDVKARLGYSVTNDKNNLYLRIETGDLATQLKIMHRGLTVWIDKTANHDEKTAINFPVPDEYKSNRPQTSESIKVIPNQEKMRWELMEKVADEYKYCNDYSLQGFKGCEGQFLLKEHDSCGIEVAMALDGEGNLFWEAKVPFASFMHKPEISRVDKGKPIGIYIETEAYKPNVQLPAQPKGNKRPMIRPSISVGGFSGMGVGVGGRNGYDNTPAPPQTTMLDGLEVSTKTVKIAGLGWAEQQ